MAAESTNRPDREEREQAEAYAKKIITIHLVVGALAAAVVLVILIFMQPGVIGWIIGALLLAAIIFSFGSRALAAKREVEEVRKGYKNPPEQ